MFNPGDVVELEGLENKFVFLKSINDQGKMFLIFTDQDDPTQLKFCVLESDKVKIIQDPKVIEYITSKLEEK